MPSTDHAAPPSAPAAGEAPAKPAADAIDAPEPAAVAEALREASYVHLLVRTDGASVAAAGLLADRLPAFRCSPVAFEASEPEADAADLQVAVGCRHPDGEPSVSGPDHALAVRRLLDATSAGDPDASEDSAVPVLAQAGAVCARLGHSGSVGDRSPDTASDSSDSADSEATEAPPVATPTDPGSGLQYGTLVHAPFAGDRAMTEAVTGDDDPTATRTRAALATIDDAPDRAAGAVERLLAPRPTPAGPLATVEGLADVLDAVARTDPGAALTVALGGDADAALDAWRTTGERVHAALRAASVTVSGDVDRVLLGDPGDAPPVELLARLHHEFRATSPATIVAGADRLGVAATDPIASARGAIESAARSALSVGPSGTTGRLRAQDPADSAVLDPIGDALGEVAA